VEWLGALDLWFSIYYNRERKNENDGQIMVIKIKKESERLTLLLPEFNTLAKTE